MYIFSSLFLTKFESVQVTFVQKNNYSKSAYKYEKLDSESHDIAEIKLTKFNLKTTEIKKFYGSLDSICEIKDILVDDISNLKKFNKNGNHCTNSSAFINKFIQTIANKRIIAKNNLACEYEFMKFCELFYNILLYIVEYKQNLQILFYQFSKKSILPILDEIESILRDFSIFLRIYDQISEKCYINKINDEIRRESLLDFLTKFIENQFQQIDIHQTLQKSTIHDLISLIYNIVTKFYLCNRSESHTYCKKFELQKYPISNIFKDYLIVNAKITGFTYECRIKIREFLRENDLSLYTKLLKNGSILPIFDVINEQSAAIGLKKIGYNKGL